MTIDLRLGDCLQIMPTLSDKSIDIVFTSVPFKDEDVQGDYWEQYAKWFSEMMRVASKAVVIIQSATKLNYTIANYPPKRTMVWGKGISQVAYRWNPIFVYQISDNYKINKHIWCDAFGVESVSGKWKSHKYQDPLLLYETVLKMFNGCESVLDPFMGSGTTGQACKNLEIDFIGIEKDAQIFAQAQLTMALEVSNA